MFRFEDPCLLPDKPGIIHECKRILMDCHWAVRTYFGGELGSEGRNGALIYVNVFRGTFGTRIQVTSSMIEGMWFDNL